MAATTRRGLMGLLWLFLVHAVFASTNHTDVTINFLNNSGQTWINPQIGEPLNHPELPAWKVDASTKLRFSFTASSNTGNLIVLLKNKKAAEIIPGQPNPDPESALSSYVEYMRVAIPLSQTGVIHEIVLGPAINTTSLAWNQEIYLGFFADSAESSSVQAICNHVQAGASFASASETSPAFTLGVLYDKGLPHPSLPAAQLTAGTNGHTFTDMGSTLPPVNQTIHGAISNYSYEVIDSATLPTGAPAYALETRIWELYRINGNTLTFEKSVAGEGELGELCRFQVPENLGPTGVRYLLLCRTIDALGHANMEPPTGLNDPELDDNCFIFEVGRDVTKNPENCLAISHHDFSTGIVTVPACGVEEVGNGEIHIMPHHTGTANDIDTTAGTQDTFSVRFQGRVSSQTIPGNTPTAVPTTPHINTIFTWPSISTGADNMPLYIEWQYSNAYGTTVFSAPLTLTYQEPIPLPFTASMTDVDWVTLPHDPAGGTPFSITYKAKAPQPGDLVMATAWIYQIENNQVTHSQLLKSPIGQACFQLTANDSPQTIDLELPPEIDSWDLSSGAELKVRLKGMWRSNTLCTANFLNDFQVLPNDVEIYAMAESSSWLIGGAEPGHFTSLIQEGTIAYVDPVYGNVDLGFEETHSGDPNPDIAWRWETTDGNHFWIDGVWQTTSGQDNTWIRLDSGNHTGGIDTFSSRWQWLRGSGEGVLKPKSLGNGSVAPPFASDGSTNLVDSFFTPPGASSRLDDLTVTVKVRMGFGERYEEKSLDIDLRLLQPDPGISSFQFEIAENGQTPACSSATQWQQASEWVGRLGQLPRMRFSLTTPGHLPSAITLRVEKRQADGGWAGTCHNPDVGIFSDDCDNSPGIGEDLVRRWVADVGSTLFQTLATNGAGEYRLKFTTETCGSPAEGTAEVTLNLNPEESFTLRFHYRDHLGSSTLSRAYTPSLGENMASTAPFKLKLNSSGSQVLVLYPRQAAKTYFTPFGKAITSVAEGEADPRYTDHEYDPESGFNYMKGRFQLATYAKFNRPDPMRDWDWENPSSINLYQYVRNNPVMGSDPTGLFILKTNAPQRILEIAGNDSSKVSIDQDGFVKVDASNDDLQNNEGLRVLHQAATSENVYIYEEGKVIETDAGPRPLRGSVENLDANEDWRYNVGKGAKGKTSENLPPNGVQAIIVFDHETTFVDAETKTQEVLPYRTAFHEIAEALAKIEDNKQYVNKDGSPGAHAQAVENEKKLIKQRPNEESYPAGGALTKKKEK